MKYVICLVIVLAVCPYSAQSQKPSDTKDPDSLAKEKLDDADSARFEIFKALWESWNSGEGKNEKPKFLHVDGVEDPSSALIKAINKVGAPVRPGSDCVLDEARGAIILDRKTGTQGVLFTISKLKWESPDAIKAEAWGHVGNMGASGCAFILKRENGAWKIISKENCWIS